MLKSLWRKINGGAWILGLMVGWAGLCSCKSQPAGNAAPPGRPRDAGAAGASAETPPDNSASILLREGDVVRITFPGAPSLDTVQTIRRDGKITLDLAGEMKELKAAGLTPTALQQQLLKAYSDQLVVKEVTVTVQSSVFTVYVTGAVMRPGKLVTDRVETPLEAVIEAGIDNSRSNLKKIIVIRENENGRTERFHLNLDDVLKGKPTPPFTLKPMDKIWVPEKFSWF